MPHKRAKRSVREDQRINRGLDEAPPSIYTSKQAITNETIPKSVSRVLNAAHIQKEWREKKRKFESEDYTGDRVVTGKKRRLDDSRVTKGMTAMKVRGQDGPGKDREKVLGIQPGESLGHFNRRVEDDMRPLVKSAIQSSSAQTRRVKKSESDSKAKSISKSKNNPSRHDAERDASLPIFLTSKHHGRPTEFQTNSTSAPRRLNDIAQAPPEFTKLPRGGDKVKSKVTMGRDGVLSMKQKLMMEREREKAIVRYRQLKERRRIEGASGERDGGNDADE